MQVYVSKFKTKGNHASMSEAHVRTKCEATQGQNHYEGAFENNFLADYFMTLYEKFYNPF